jgi:hypothetical protein
MKTTWVLLILFFGFEAASEYQPLGEFRFYEFSLAPEYKTKEPGESGFELKESYLKTQWVLSTEIHGQIAFGTGDLIKPAVWYSPATKSIDLTEAFVYAKTDTMDFTVGLFRIPVGYEGFFPESSRVFPSTQARSDGFVIKRDLGFQAQVNYQNYQTTLGVHNGESGLSSDGKTWITGSWSYAPAEGMGFILTGQVGKISSASTAGSVANSNFQFNFDPLVITKIRQGTLSLFKHWGRNHWVIEATRGDILQGDTKSPFAFGFGETALLISKDTFFLLRYEQTQSQLNLSETIKKYSSIGFSLSSKNNLASLTFYATKINEEPEVQNDEFKLLFRLGSGFED